MERGQKRAHGRNLRKGRCSIPGQIYLITMGTKSRRRVFQQFRSARWAARCLHGPDVRCHAQTLAYVVMPDHVHWLLQLQDTGNLAIAVRLYKAKVTIRLGESVWQHGYHDRALRAEDDVVSVSRYVVANPLRAGLVDTIRQYPYWDAIWLTGNAPIKSSAMLL